MDKSLLQYYLQELASLDDDCAVFSQAYPSVAANLGLGSEGATDPHVKQLIESVAFIAARLKRHIDAASHEMAYGLLQSLVPQLLAPLPAMSVVRFVPRNAELEPVASRPPGGMHLSADSVFCKNIKFTLAGSPLVLWPLDLKCAWGGEIRQQPLNKEVLNKIADDDFVMKLEHPAKPVAAGDPGELTFFISGSLNRALSAIEAFASGVQTIRLVSSDGSWSTSIGLDQLEILGYDDDHRLLPFASDVSGQALELLNYPRRFCFFRIRGIHCTRPVRTFYLVFSIAESWRDTLDAVRQHIHLNCAPIVNIFKHGPVALNLNGSCDVHQISRPEMGRGSWDVYAVRQVKLVAPNAQQDIHELHAGSRLTDAFGGTPYWQGVRSERINAKVGHASLGIRFTNLNRSNADHGVHKYETALVDLFLTQCNDPAALTAGQRLAVSGWDGGYQALLEFVPTTYVEPLLPTSARIPILLKSLQWRGAGENSLVTRVRMYLASHDRSGYDHCAEWIRALKGIEKKLVAMPWEDLNVGPLVMGCSYVMQLASSDPSIPMQFLFPRVLKSIIAQSHDLPMPMEVQTRYVDGEGEVNFVQ